MLRINDQEVESNKPTKWIGLAELSLGASKLCRSMVGSQDSHTNYNSVDVPTLRTYVPKEQYASIPAPADIKVKYKKVRKKKNSSWDSPLESLQVKSFQPNSLKGSFRNAVLHDDIGFFKPMTREEWCKKIAFTDSEWQDSASAKKSSESVAQKKKNNSKRSAKPQGKEKELKRINKDEPSVENSNIQDESSTSESGSDSGSKEKVTSSGSDTQSASSRSESGSKSTSESTSESGSDPESDAESDSGSEVSGTGSSSDTDMNYDDKVEQVEKKRQLALKEEDLKKDHKKNDENAKRMKIRGAKKEENDGSVESMSVSSEEDDVGSINQMSNVQSQQQSQAVSNASNASQIASAASMGGSNASNASVVGSMAGTELNKANDQESMDQGLDYSMSL